jgi:DnaJ-class molecular chaperone
LKINEGRIEMDKNFAPGKYGMVICPLCDGKGVLIKDSEGTGVSVRKVCIKCGGFGAIKREEKVFRSLGIKSN